MRWELPALPTYFSFDDFDIAFNVEEETGMSRAHLTETPSSPQLENIDIAGINNDNGGNVSQGGGIAQPQPRQPVPEPIAPRRGRGRLLPRQSTDQPNKKFQEYMKTLSERIVKERQQKETQEQKELLSLLAAAKARYFKLKREHELLVQKADSLGFGPIARQLGIDKLSKEGERVLQEYIKK